MADLKYAVTPGLLDSGNGTLTIIFTEPEQAANVKISVFEADSWSIDGTRVKENDGTDDLRSEIFGTIKDRKFAFIRSTSSASFTTDDQGNPVAPGIMNLLLEHDGTQSIIPIQNLDKDNELGFFEVLFEVTADIDGKPLTRRMPTPVFVRNTPTVRAQVAYIAGTGADFASEPATLEYFKQARDFWEKHSDNMAQIQSISANGAPGIQDIIDDLSDPARKTARNNLPWGAVNIVCHGNEETMFIRERSSDPAHKAFESRSVFLFDSRNGVSDAMDMSELAKPNVAHRTPAEVFAGALDAQSMIVIRGCEIGNDQELLDEIRQVFGGEAVVFAPLLSMVYMTDSPTKERPDPKPQERLMQKWEFFLPGAGPFPSDNKVVKELKAKYGPGNTRKGPHLYESLTDGDWAAVAAIRADFKAGFRARVPAFREIRIDTVDFGPVKGLRHDSIFELNSNTLRSDHELFKATQFTINNVRVVEEIGGKDVEHFPVKDFEWRWKPEKDTPVPGDPDPDRFILTLQSVRSLYRIFRMLTVSGDGKGDLATPDTVNPKHFAVSPSR